MAKDKDYIRLISSARWLSLRRRKISAHPLCQRCQEQGRVTAATEVHHVVPVETGLGYADKQRLAYDWANLMSLCHDCHVAIHTEIGRSGKRQARQKAERQVERFRKKFL